MRFMKQFAIIAAVSLLGELLAFLLPLPIPASIYGIVLMFAALALKIIPLSAVKTVSAFLIEIMPLMFIPAAVGLMNAWGVLAPIWLPVVVIMAVSTFAVMGVTGRVTQAVLRRRQRKEADQ